MFLSTGLMLAGILNNIPLLHMKKMRPGQEMRSKVIADHVRK